MKEVSFKDAINLVYRNGEYESIYKKELTDFIKSPFQCAELEMFGSKSTESACSSYRKIASTYGFPVKIVERSGKVVAYKKQTYDLLRKEIDASHYADRIINSVKDEEERMAFMKQWDY